MQRIVVDVAQRNGEFVRHLEAQGARLGEANVMRLGGAAAADETGLAGDKGEMRLIAHAHLFGDEQSAGGVDIADGAVGDIARRTGFAAGLRFANRSGSAITSRAFMAYGRRHGTRVRVVRL